MYKKSHSFIIILLLIIACQPKQPKQRNIDFNSDWQFYLSQDSTVKNIDLNAVNWNNINLPHDWDVEFSFDSINEEGCDGYLPSGIGWYKKEFVLEASENEKVYICFDGVYNNSEYWINDKKLGFHPYGYSPFYFDLSNYLNTNGEANQLVVKVDHSCYADGRRSKESCIYRNVELVKVNKLHIPFWGTYITTNNVSAKSADIEIETTINNTNNEHQTCNLITQIYDDKGVVVATLREDGCFFKTGSSTVKQKFSLESPQIWDVESPNIYSAKTTLVCNNQVIDEYETSFGVRSFKFDKEEGFFLNGKSMKIKGVCLHHDVSLKGNIVPKDVLRRRLLVLKDEGCNAIRLSYNPASNEFLDLCDEMGFLVQDEFFDEWDDSNEKRLNMSGIQCDYINRGYTEHFHEWAQTELNNTILAHRNHPSIFRWCFGNEIDCTYKHNR